MKKILLAVMLAVVSMFGISGSSVAEAAEGANLGFVSLDAVFNAYPGIADAQKKIFAEQEKLQKEFVAKAEGLSNEEKTKLQQELNRKLAQKQLEVMRPIQEKISQAVAKAAGKKNIAQVVKAEIMLFGGVDLTPDVISLVKGQSEAAE